MKKFKRIIIISISIILLMSAIVFICYRVFKDENSLTIGEKTWISANKNSVYSINVPNDINVFGKNGNGVYYDFISDLDHDLGLKLNTNVYSIESGNDSLGFNVGNTFDDRDLLLYTDYYVLVGNSNDVVTNLKSISEKKVGVINSQLEYISSRYEISSTIKTYDNSTALFDALSKKEIDYVIVPLNNYKDVVINKSYNILYYFNDLKVYYYIHLVSDDHLNSIITKYYNTWMQDDFDKSYNTNNYDLIIENLELSEVQLDSLTDKTYDFTYLPNSPYQTLSKGNFIGIVSNYLTRFNEFSGVDFNFIKEHSYKDLTFDIKKKKPDLYFNQIDYNSSYKDININFPINYYLISNYGTFINIDNIESFKGTIYVEKNSLLFNYVSSLKNIVIKTYSKNSELKKILKKGNIAIVDKLSYDNYISDFLSHITIRYTGMANTMNYSFKLKTSNDTFNKLFRAFVTTINPNEMIDLGLANYYDTYESGRVFVKLAKYIILLVVAILTFIFLLIRNNKKIVLNTRVKKDEKIRYVDMMTSLKNRNYLNDRLEIWNQNTVYPQAVIVLDLNNVKYLNDTFGHQEGDKQIKALANILFRFQLDNTELLRTDGNEFMIYLVGYSEKQIVSYIKKLFKEFKKLPYEYGVAVGFSMINDDLKLIEDAFNEASILMRKNKSSFEDDDEK